MSGKIRNRRHTRIVDKDLQTRIILQVSWPMAFVLLVTAAVLVMFVMHLRGEAARLEIDPPGLLALVSATLILFVFGVAAQVMIALLVSHRIAGSAYRIRQTLRSFRGGNVKVRARLRTGDLHTRLADDVNEFLDWVEHCDGAIGRPESALFEPPRRSREDAPV